jgi:hypothetical protein
MANGFLMVMHMVILSKNIGMPGSVLTEFLVLIAFWSGNEFISWRFLRHVDQKNQPTWHDPAGNRTGLQYLEQEKPHSVQIVRHPRGAGAFFDQRRHQIHASVPSLNRSDLDTIWNVCHELWHPTQIVPFWRTVFRSQHIGELLWMIDIILVGCRDFAGSWLSRIPSRFFVVTAIIAGLSYFWGDFLPELDAVIHTPEIFARCGLTWSNPDEAKAWVNDHTRLLIVRYLSSTLAITVTLTLLVMMISQVIIT